MIFNIFLANQPPERLKKLYDLLRPIEHGLAESGHHVIGYGLGLLPAPAVNLFVEFFVDDAFVENLLKLKSGSGERLVLGLLSADDVEDDDAMESARYPNRRANLERVLATADFVWTLLPQLPFYESVCGAGNAAMIELGFSERLLNRHVIGRPDLRDLDVVIDGDATPRRQEVIETLRSRGFKCHLSGPSPLPSFAATDIARRAKILLDMRRGPSGRFSSPRRINKGLHNGVLVMTEQARMAAGGLERFAAPCDPAKIADDCTAALNSGLAVDLGLSALAQFRAATSVRDGLRSALQVPALRRAAT